MLVAHWTEELFLSNWLQSWTSEEQPVPWIRDSINTNNNINILRISYLWLDVISCSLNVWGTFSWWIIEQISCSEYSQATATGRHKAADRFHWGLPDQHVHIVKVATDGAPLRRNRRGDIREIDLLFKYQQAPYHTQVYALYYSGIWRHIIKIYQNELSHKSPWSNGARQTIPLIASALSPNDTCPLISLANGKGGISLAESVAELGCLAPYPSVTATGTITASCSKRDEIPMAVSTFTHTSLCSSSWRCSWNNTVIAARAKTASCRPCRRRNLLAGQGPRPQSQEKTVTY